MYKKQTLTLFTLLLPLLIATALLGGFTPRTTQARPALQRASPPDGLTTAEWSSMKQQMLASMTTTEQAKLTADDAAANDSFGASVAIDGDTAIIGAFGDDDGGIGSGSAYIFTRNGTTWSQQAKLTADDASINDFFGKVVAISGNTVIVGAYFDDDDGDNSGSAYIFTRSGVTWSQQAKLTASDAVAIDWFGYAVALDGNTAIISAIKDDDGGFNSGSIYAFTRSGITWSQQAKITSGDLAAEDYFGAAVALDGNTTIISAFGDDDDGASSGSTYIFTRSGVTWSQQAKLTASDAAAGDRFGYEVSIDEDTVVIGAYLDDDTEASSGSAYIFTRSGVTWSQQAKLTANDAAESDWFGYAVDIDGNTAVISAYRDDVGGENSGSAYVFTRNGATWSQQTKLTASDGAADDQFGSSISMYEDTVIISSPQDDASSGSVYVFSLQSRIYLPAIMQ